MSANLQNATISNRFKVGRRLGAGSFGELYAATDLSNNSEVALKIESIRSSHPQLQYESRVYKALAGGGFNFNSRNTICYLVWCS